MTATARSSGSWDWRQLASLGEQLRNENSLSAQRDRIVSMTSRLIDGKVDVWLQENVFRLPDWEAGRVFPAQPPKGGMRLAIKAGKLTTQKINRKTKTATRLAFAAIPLEAHGVTLGALQITRAQGPAFSPEERNLLRGLAQIAAVSLFASHRAEVEQVCLMQINLGRAVSDQIANVLNMGELAKRVSEIMPMTVNY